MRELTLEERVAFVEAASAVLAQRERIEFLRDQAIAARGDQAEKFTMQRPEAEGIVNLAANLCCLLTKLKQQHPRIGAFRFRRHLFVLTHHKGQVIGMEIIADADIESIEG